MNRICKKVFISTLLDRIDKFFIFILVSFSFSCEKDNVFPDHLDLPVTYYFVKSDFIDDILCYDTLGNKIDQSYSDFIQNDFLFSDGSFYPFETIEILKDSIVSYSYTNQEIVYYYEGWIASDEDSLCFYITENHNVRLLFKGYIKDEKLRIPAYGYKMVFQSEWGFLSSTWFGCPNISNLVENMNKYSDETIERLYIQKFELVYEK